jgi:hypothetical protein
MRGFGYPNRGQDHERDGLCGGLLMGDFTTPGSRAGHGVKWLSKAIDLAFGLGVGVGQILVRGVNGWQIINASGNDNLLATNAGSPPSFKAISGILDTIFGSAEGNILQRGVASWQVLAPGTAGALLQSGGASALNAWGPTYARGSWTPSDASGASLTFTGVSAEYVQVGDMVWISAQLTYPSTVSAANAAIGGLPFTAANQNYAKGFALVLGAPSGGGSILVSKNTTTAFLFTINASAALTNAQFSGTAIVFNLWYPIN